MESVYQINEVKLSYKRKKSVPEELKIRASDSVYQLLLKCYDKDTIDYRESFKVVLLSGSNKLLGVLNVSEGGMNETFVDVRLIMQSVLLSNASGIILSHNHPSGVLMPSIPDNKLTDKIRSACEIMNIQLLDHLIITSESYFSYADSGRL